MMHMTLLMTMLAIAANPGHSDLVGKVADADQKPIPQATVFIYTARPRVGVGVLCPSCYVDCKKKATTADDGKFLIADLDNELLFKVLVVAEGFRPQFAENVDPKEPLDIKIEPMPSDLSDRTVLRGRVLNPDGKPVVGAVLVVTGYERGNTHGWGGMRDVDPVSVTNSRGEFLVTGKKSEDTGWEVRVDARGFAKQRILLPLNGEVHEIRLDEGATVQGRILKDGKPVSGVEVGLVQCNKESSQFLGDNRIATNNDGQFTFTNIQPKEYFLYLPMKETARLGGNLPLSQFTVGTDNSHNNAGDLELSPTVHKISGRVILTDDKPIPATMRMILSREDAWDYQAVVVNSFDGSFSFKGVPEEVVTINACIPGYRLAGKRNRMQQTRPSEVAIFVDADRPNLELYFEPEPAKEPQKDK
jgi:hypothetical protein